MTLIMFFEANLSNPITVSFHTARLAQSVEHETLNLRVVGSSPTLGDTLVIRDKQLVCKLHSRAGTAGKYVQLVSSHDGGPVAQWITRLTTDQKIPGSTPGWLN